MSTDDSVFPISHVPYTLHFSEDDFPWDNFL